MQERERINLEEPALVAHIDAAEDTVNLCKGKKRLSRIIKAKVIMVCTLGLSRVHLRERRIRTDLCNSAMGSLFCRVTKTLIINGKTAQSKEGAETMEEQYEMS